MLQSSRDVRRDEHGMPTTKARDNRGMLTGTARDHRGMLTDNGRDQHGIDWQIFIASVCVRCGIDFRSGSEMVFSRFLELMR